MKRNIVIAALSVLSLALIAGLFLFLKNRGSEESPVEEDVPEIISSYEEPERFDPSTVETGPAAEAVSTDAAGEEKPQESSKPSVKPANSASVDTQQGGEVTVYFKPDGGAPQPSNSITEMMNPQEKALADDIVSQLGISGSAGNVYFQYRQPEVPDELHLSVQLEVFSESSETLFRYVSDAGWLTDSRNYDPSAHDVVLRLDGVDSLENKMFIITVKVGDSSLTGEMAMYQIMRNYDGTEGIWAVHVTDNASGSVTYSEIVNLEYSFFEAQ